MSRSLSINLGWKRRERGQGFGLSPLQVYNNGYVSLGSGVTDGYTPQPFPFRGAPMISPYWADVDTRVGSGRVYYHESVSSSDGTRASSIVRIAYSTNFIPTRVFFVTWNQDLVGYYSRHQNRVSYKNLSSSSVSWNISEVSLIGPNLGMGFSLMANFN